MSRSVDLFIDSVRELPDVAERLGRLIGTPLEPGDDGQRYVLTEGAAVAYLGRHRFIDDGDLPFSRYAYVLSAWVAPGVPVADSAELALLCHVAELLRQRTSAPVLLVHDLQFRDRATPSAGRGGRSGGGGPSGAEASAAHFDVISPGAEPADAQPADPGLADAGLAGAEHPDAGLAGAELPGAEYPGAGLPGAEGQAGVGAGPSSDGGGVGVPR